MKDKIQELFEDCLGYIEKARAKEAIDKANKNFCTMAAGKRIAYSHIADILINMGAKAPKEECE